MTRVRTWRVYATTLALGALLLASCGQKPGVYQQYAGPGAQAGALGSEGAPLGADPVAPGDAPLAGAEEQVPGQTGATAADRQPAAGTEPGTRAGTPRAGTGDEPANGPVDRTGVTDKVIKIGIHAPVTGAAAFPQQSFERGVGVYADYINSKGGINGRKLQVVFRDDRFDPNSARAACKDLAEQQKVFLLIGGGGADQIDACARYASAMGVPYLSAGVHQTRPGLGSLNALRTYFALSLTYEQQVPLLTNLVRTEFSGQKVALIVADNDSLNKFYGLANSSLKKAMGQDLVLSRRIPKQTDTDAPAIATQICNSGAKAVVWNASPSGLINVSKSMTCTVQFLGPGNTNGLNIVATGGCPNVDNAQFFSSFPGLDKIDQMDPAFTPAYRKKNGSAPDDIGIALWGVEKLVAQILAASGKDLSRQKFMATLSSGKAFSNGVYPTVKFGDNTRFGGTAMHLLQADCNSRQYRTKKLNVTS